MTRTNIIKSFITGVFSILLLCSIIHSSNSLLSERKQNYVTVAASSEIAYSSALLGGFKGIIADVLWLRLTDLQSENKLLELLELSELVTQLEPHIPEVWTFHAWNLSYNISLLATNKEDRWIWVMRGIEMLRDKGLEINPNDPTIALELAWIFQHKIGTKDVDSNGHYYRTEWIQNIAPYLGENGSIPDLGSIAAAELEQQFKLNPQTMMEIENTFGKIDWRAPYAHSLYWGWIANKSNAQNSKQSSTRMIYSSAVKLALDAGIVLGNPLLDQNWQYKVEPDYSLIESTHKYIYNNIYKFETPGIKHMFAGLTWMGCKIMVEKNEMDVAYNIYSRFTSCFDGYNFPTMEDFINNQAELDAFGYCIDENLITLKK